MKFKLLTLTFLLSVLAMQNAHAQVATSVNNSNRVFAPENRIIVPKNTLEAPTFNMSAAETRAITLQEANALSGTRLDVIDSIVKFLASQEALELAGKATIPLAYGFAISQIHSNPYAIEAYLGRNPSQIPLLKTFINPFPWHLGYLDVIGVGDIHYQRQKKLEETVEWANAYKIIATSVAKTVDETNPQTCTDEDRKVITLNYKLFNDSPRGRLANQITVNYLGNTKKQSGVTLYDVNSYRVLDNLSTPKDGLENDHIPSKGALLKRFGEHIEDTLKNKDDATAASSISYNIEMNATAMNVPRPMHLHGRTWGTKNSQEQMSEDGFSGANLRNATIADLANHLIYVKIHDQSHMQSFILSAIALYTRNKLLCLYD